MALFDKGRHTFNEKYERLSDVYRLANQYKKRRRSHRTHISGGFDDEGREIVLSSRKEKYGKRRAGIWKKIWRSLPFKNIPLLFAKFRGRIRAIDETRATVLLGYIPIKIFFGLCVITCGLYPYVWMWDNTYAFNKMRGSRIREEAIKRFAVLGFTVQLLLPASIGMWIVWKITGSAVTGEIYQTTAFVFLSLYFVVIFPMRCFNYFCVRWSLRSAVREWDTDGVMINRSITSWSKLFLFGSIYIQRHINRLMGLGMPGFSDPSEIEGETSFLDIIDDYIVMGKPDRIAASWTKDDFEPGDDGEFEEYGEFDEEYDG